MGAHLVSPLIGIRPITRSRWAHQSNSQTARLPRLEMSDIIASTKKGKAFRQLGVDIFGDASIDSIGEDFGQPVAVSSNYRLVAGARRINYANMNGRGRIYTFQYQSNTKDWIPMQSFPIAGEVAGDQLDTAVDMCLDGTVIIAGAVGRGNGTGVVMIYF